MPELPEVEVVKLSLKTLFKVRKLIKSLFLMKIQI